jgi:hypothetical protein
LKFFSFLTFPIIEIEADIFYDDEVSPILISTFP